MVRLSPMHSHLIAGVDHGSALVIHAQQQFARLIRQCPVGATIGGGAIRLCREVARAQRHLVSQRLGTLAAQPPQDEKADQDSENEKDDAELEGKGGKRVVQYM